MAGSRLTDTGQISAAILKPIHSVIEGHPSVVLAYLFGSRVQRNVGPLSDVDVALLLDETDETDSIHSNVRSAIGSAIYQERVDVVFLNRAPVELAYAIIANGALIYERSVAARVEYEAKIMSLYCDYLPVLRAQRADILNGEEYETRVQRYREALGRTERALGTFRGAQG